MNRPLLLLALPFLLTACIIQPDDHCSGGEYQKEPVPLQEHRNPDTGSCEAFGGGGGGGGGGGTGCGDQWGGAATDQAPVPLQDWAICYQQCEGLDEQSCLGTSACRASYGETAGVRYFNECWGTAPSGPVQGGGCAGLDAYPCSMHDDCSAVHQSLGAPDNNDGLVIGIGGFISCIDEPGMQGCYGDDQCGEGFHCNASTECLPDPSCGTGGGGGQTPVPLPCDSVCYGFCEPDTQPNPGTCDGFLACDILPPACPIDTLPGILDGCYTGYCIPVNDCASAAECPTLGESACVLRSDCNPIYQGLDCSCTGDSCSCADWVFSSCEAGITVLPAGV